MSKGLTVGYHPGMRFRYRLLVLALGVAGCTTTPPQPSLVVPAAASYRSSADAPRILDTLDQKMAGGELHPSELSTSDLTVYSNLLLSAGRFVEAEKYFELLEARTPQDRTVLWTLTLLAGTKGPEAQQARLDAFEKTWPNTTEAVELRADLAAARGDRAGAKAAWTQLLSRGENPSALSGLAQQALDDKKPQEALGFADRAVAASPQDDALWALRAQALVDLKRYPEARRDLDKAVVLAPDNSWHRLDRGRLLLRQFYQFDAARADLEESTIRNPADFLAWEALAETYEELDRPRQAWDAWQKTLSLRPDYYFAYPSAAMLAFRYQDWDQAIRYAREAAKAYPAEYAFPFVEALSLRAKGQLAAAQTTLERARPRFERGSTVDAMFRFLLTPGSDYYLNAALNQEKRENVRLRLRFYQGCYYALTKSPASARAAFDEVQASTLLKIPEITAARDWLEHGL